ncbi:CopG family transcriptional regulator [Streptomyces sp. NPDC020298]|uniref:CopG family transcriptional regulator n=1 Tax=unclassified Streptomyces TaxID=2593676 RepID=UPI0033D8293D
MSEAARTDSITMLQLQEVAEAARARSGPSGLSACVAAPVARQIERDNLTELIQAAEAEHGRITEDEVQALRDQLRHTRAAHLPNTR